MGSGRAADHGAPRVSIVMPAYDEADAIEPVLARIHEQVTLPHEVLVVVDSPDDTTVPAVRAFDPTESTSRIVVNDIAQGPAHAIRAGFKAAGSPVVVVTMADGSDDPAQIDVLTRLVDRGVVVAAASRYMRGGQQVGGSAAKKTLSAGAGRSLRFLARTGITDATNSFKAYDKSFVESVGIHSTAGFEVGLELVAKARRTRHMMAEIPTIWLDRSIGSSNFRLVSWLPHYLRWYRFAFGARLTPDEVWQLCEPAGR
jgi:glycosyltransferase involved in cell wall biosynthesis